MPAGVIVAAAQTVPMPGQVHANLASHLALGAAAASHQATIVVFPELSLTGYELERADELAFSEQDERLAPLRAFAEAASITFVVGAPVRTAEAPSRLHIGAFIVSPSGELALYTKRHLGVFPASANPGGPVPPPEGSTFEAGDRDPMVTVGTQRAAFAICADTGDAAHPRAARARGATLYLASMFFTVAERDDERARLAGYAEEHGMAVVVANFGGTSGGLTAGGGSAVLSSRGECLAEVVHFGEDLAFASI